jgi:hypothetical protein
MRSLVTASAVFDPMGGRVFWWMAIWRSSVSPAALMADQTSAAPICSEMYRRVAASSMYA